MEPNAFIYIQLAVLSLFFLLLSVRCKLHPMLLKRGIIRLDVKHVLLEELIGAGRVPMQAFSACSLAPALLCHLIKTCNGVSLNVQSAVVCLHVCCITTVQSD